MHTIMVIAGGLVLLAAFVLIAGFIGKSRSKAALYFIPVWFICAAVNLWIGVSHAGYTVADELPIFLVVFGVPAVAAFFLSRRTA